MLPQPLEQEGVFPVSPHDQSDIPNTVVDHPPY